MYSILISVREGLNHSTSPGGLPNGCYNGHTFWDVEQFIWPSLLLLHAPIAANGLQYRFDRLAAARANAERVVGAAGLKFPWESASSGLEATPYYALRLSQTEVHISGDVSLAVWQYYQASRDLGWLRSVGWPILRGVAQFWSSRATALPGGQYALLHVLGCDERWDGSVNNSAFDLAVAELSLRRALHAASLVGAAHEVGANWSAIASGLLAAVPRDAALGTIREFDGATAAMNLKGLGVILMRYPLNVSRRVLDDATHRRNLEFYARLWPQANAMFWWAFATGYAELGMHAQAATFFAKTTVNNVFGPFLIWSENAGGGGCPNFITGAGGYLQALWAGFAGVRFADDALHIYRPHLPPGSAVALALRRLGYAGAYIDINITTSGADVSLASIGTASEGPVYICGWRTRAPAGLGTRSRAI